MIPAATVPDIALAIIVLGAVLLALAVDLGAAIGWLRRRCTNMARHMRSAKLETRTATTAITERNAGCEIDEALRLRLHG